MAHGIDRLDAGYNNQGPQDAVFPATAQDMAIGGPGTLESLRACLQGVISSQPARLAAERTSKDERHQARKAFIEYAACAALELSTFLGGQDDVLASYVNTVDRSDNPKVGAWIWLLGRDTKYGAADDRDSRITQASLATNGLNSRWLGRYRYELGVDEKGHFVGVYNRHSPYNNKTYPYMFEYSAGLTRPEDWFNKSSVKTMTDAEHLKTVVKADMVKAAERYIG
jgi:hypothetical protein